MAELKQMDEKLAWLRQSNRTLAVVGKFRQDDPHDVPRYVFSPGSPDGKPQRGPVKPYAFFEQVQPELRLQDDGETVTIGQLVFNSYRLSTPLVSAPRSRSQPISLESALLSALDGLTMAGGDQAEQIRKIGGQQFRELMQDLDVVARFAHSRFPRALLAVVQHYLLLSANERLSDRKKLGVIDQKVQVSNQRFAKHLAEDQMLANQFVTFLCCCEADEGRAINGIRAALKGRGLVETRYETDAIDCLTEALDQLKDVLETAHDRDNAWSKMKHEPAFQGGWLEHYSSHPEFGFSTGLGSIDTFLAHYQIYRKHSDRVHRFARTPTLHAFVFCWLAGKYANYGMADMNEVSHKMYELSVLTAGDDRVYGDSMEVIQSNLKQAHATGQAFIEKTGRSEEMQDAREIYVPHAELVQDMIRESLNPIRKFDSAALARRLESLFVMLKQLTEGPIALIHERNEKLRMRLLRFKNTILGATAAGAAKLTEATFAAALNQAAQPADELVDERAFVAEVLRLADEAQKAHAQAPGGAAAEGERLRSVFTNAFIQAYTETCQRDFAEQFLKIKGQVKQQAAQLKRLYRLRSALALTAADDQAPLPAIVVSELPMERPKESAATKETRRKSFLTAGGQAIQSRFQPIGTLEIAMPKTISDQLDAKAIPADEAGVVRASGQYVVDEEKIADVQIADKRLQISVADPKNLPRLMSEKARLQVNDLGSFSAQEVNAGGSLDRVIAASPPDSSLLAEYVELSRACDDIQDKYLSAGTAVTDLIQAFRQKSLAWLFGEYVAGAPAEEKTLDKADISQAIGLTIDALEALADPRLGAKLFQPAPDDVTLGRLMKINLSKYFPVANDPEKGPAELSDVLQFHTVLCKSLTDVAGFLLDLREVRDAFMLLQNEHVLVVVLNETLPEHVERVKARSRYVFVEDAPAYVWLTGQAAAAAGLAPFSEKLLDCLGHAEAANLQVPLIASRESLNAGAAMPLVTPAQVVLPALAPEPGDGKSPQEAGTIIAASVRRQEPLGPPQIVVSSHLSLLLSLLTNNPDLLGRASPKVDIGTSLEDFLKNQVGMAFNKGKPLVDYFRRVWLDWLDPPGKSHAHAALLHNLIFVKWINMALLLKAAGADEKGGKLIERALEWSDSGAAPFDTDEDAAKGVSPLVNAAFSGPALAPLRVPQVARGNTSPLKQQPVYPLADGGRHFGCELTINGASRVIEKFLKIDWKGQYKHLDT